MNLLETLNWNYSFLCAYKNLPLDLNVARFDSKSAYIKCGWHFSYMGGKEKVIEKILAIEKEMGRIRTKKNAPRLIDIDILFFNKEIIQTQNLTVPHPALQNRRFVLVPLNELSPNFIHPVLHNTIHQILLTCPDTLAVKKI